MANSNVNHLLNKIAPYRTRTNCNDENSNGNKYFDEYGFPRYPRCAIIHLLENGCWPHDTEVASIEIRFNTD